MSKMTFTSVNGYDTSVAAQAEAITSLLAAFEAVAYASGTRGIELGLGSEITIRLVYLHNLFARMTSADALDEDRPIAPRIDRLSKEYRPTLRSELAFVVGVVNDPYLYADDEAFQQAAVVNLHKARTILKHRIEVLTEPHRQVTKAF